MENMSAMGRHKGFTIVELLIVIVVIAILAAISIVAYTGIQNRANDTAVQNDLKNFGQKFMEFQTISGRLPGAPSDFTPMNLKASKSSYGSHYTPAASNGYNMAYCPNSDGTFAIVAASVSGNVYVFRNGSLTPGVGPLATINTTCSNNGQITTGAVWFFSNGAWQSYIGG